MVSEVPGLLSFLGSRSFKGSRGSRISEVPGFQKLLGSRSLRVSEVPGFKGPGFQRFQGSRCSKVQGFRGSRVPEVPEVSGFQSSMVPEIQRFQVSISFRVKFYHRFWPRATFIIISALRMQFFSMKHYFTRLNMI